MNNNLLNDNEMAAARACLDKALARGADKARVTAAKSATDLVGTLDGQTDKITHCLDRSLTLNLFVDGRYGSFSTNRCDTGDLDAFVDKAVATVRLLAPDPWRNLPAPERVAKNAVTGLELDLYDDSVETVTPEQRVAAALQASVTHSPEAEGDGWKLISEEGEYSDGIYDTLTLDSNGTCCRQMESSFDYGAEVTVQDNKGRRYSGYWWDSSTRRDGLGISSIGPEAVRRAAAQISPKRLRSGKYTVVVDSGCASKMVSPLLGALNGYSLQQHDSFLEGSLGRQIFPDGLTIIDTPHILGQSGSRLFDSEGVATHTSPIIENGVVRQYSLNTYMSAKMGLAPTIEDFSRPKVMPWPQAGMSREDIMRMCGDGVLVTGFNGGNSNPATGDFSYGIEGFAFEGGVITHPIREMVMTGNFLQVWARLLACGDDARPCMAKLIPTLAFSGMDISA